MAGTIVANTINTDTGVFTTNNAYSGIAKAWVNFAGSTINNSFNVSSVTVNGTGDFTINFTTAMTNTTYAIVGTAVSNIASINPAILTPKVGGTLTTSAFQIQCPQYNGTLVAVTSVNAVILGS